MKTELRIAERTLRSSLFYARDRFLARRDPHHGRHLRFADHKKSDTLFVLGSGGSINDITAAQWRTIAAHDSLGFNNWLVHAHVPTYYALELPSTTTPARARTIDNTQHNLALAAPRYAGVPFLLASDRAAPLCPSFLPAALRPFAYVIPMQLVLGTTSQQVAFALHVHRALGHCTPRPHCSHMLKKRASVFRHVYFGLLAGYQRIVLAGIDLNNTPYFFDDHARGEHPHGYRLDHVLTQNPGPVHRTNDPTEGQVTVAVMLEILERIALRPLGVELRLLHSSSALYPQIPLLESVL